MNNYAHAVGIPKIPEHLGISDPDTQKAIRDIFRQRITTTAEISDLLTKIRAVKSDSSNHLTSLIQFLTQHGVKISYSVSQKIEHRIQQLRPTVTQEARTPPRVRQEIIVTKKAPKKITPGEAATEVLAKLEKKHKATAAKAKSKEESMLFDYASEKTALYMYERETKKFPLLSQQEEQELGHLIRTNNDEHAFIKFVQGNLRLVLTVANSFRWKGVDFEDLVQEGNLGLMVAVRKFDPSLGFKFSTYGFYWIEHFIRRAIADYGSIVRRPVHILDSKTKLFKLKQQLRLEFHRDPLLQEIAERAGMPTEKIVHILQSTAHLQHRSLDAAVYSRASVQEKVNGEATLGDFLIDETVTSPDLIFEGRDNLRLIESVIEKLLVSLETLDLPERNRSIFKAYHGLDGSTERVTLEEIGTVWGVTRERIRQINEKIWQKLQAIYPNMDRDALSGYLLSIEDLSTFIGEQSSVFTRPINVPQVEGFVFPKNFTFEVKTEDITPMLILQIVCQAYAVNIDPLITQERWTKGRYEWAAQVSLYLMQKDLKLSFKEAAAYFSKKISKNPSNEIGLRLAEDTELLSNIEAIRNCYADRLKVAKEEIMSITDLEESFAGKWSGIASNVLYSVSKEANVPILHILSKSKADEISFARHVAIYMFNTDFTVEDKEIAKLFNIKDRSSVWSLTKKIENALIVDNELQDLVRNVRANYSLDMHEEKLDTIEEFQKILFSNQIPRAKEILRELDRKLERVTHSLQEHIKDERQKSIFMSRYYVNGNPRQVLALEEVGRLKGGITRERVRQIIAPIWDKIKKDEKVSFNSLKEFEAAIQDFKRWRELIFKSEMSALPTAKTENN